MYSFSPTEEQQMLLDAVKRFTEGDLGPAAREADEKASIPPELIEKGWELGILQASIPEDYDGFGEYSCLTGVLAAEGFAYGDLSITLAVQTPNLFVLPIYLVGSEEQKKEFIPAVIEAEWKAYTAALIEPTFNFDPLELSTIATSNGNSYIINGEKTYVPFAEEAENILVYANLDGKTQGFIIPRNTEGLTVGERQKTLGINALPLYSVKFEEVKISIGQRLNGSEGHEMDPIMARWQVSLAAMAVGRDISR